MSRFNLGSSWSHFMRVENIPPGAEKMGIVFIKIRILLENMTIGISKGVSDSSDGENFVKFYKITHFITKNMACGVIKIRNFVYIIKKNTKI